MAVDVVALQASAFWNFIFLIVSLIMYIPFIFIIIILFVKYPIRAFMRGKAIGLDPMPNRKMRLVPLDDDKELARTKDGSYVFTQPGHFYIESKSKKPIALMDSRVGKTISLDAYALMTLLKERGYNSFNQMIMQLEQDKDAKLALEGKNLKIDKEYMKDFKKAIGEEVDIDGYKIKLTDDMLKSLENTGHIDIRLEGKSLLLQDAVNYFAETIPGDVIESKIQYRAAVENLKSRKKDYFQWIIVMGFFMICAGFAVLLLSYAAPAISTAVGTAGAAAASNAPVNTAIG